jgi:hypothetical protein
MRDELGIGLIGIGRAKAAANGAWDALSHSSSVLGFTQTAGGDAVCSAYTATGLRLAPGR